MASSFGKNITFSVFGQSHGQAIGIVIDGLPAGERIDMEALSAFMGRRAPGRRLTTPRKEGDSPRFVSGVVDGVTCGAPLCAVIENSQQRSGDYAALADTPRPAHADFPAHVRFRGFEDARGGGHFSGRLTAPLCIAGGICMQILSRRGVHVGAHILSIGSARDTAMDAAAISPEQLDALAASAFPVLDPGAVAAMEAEVAAAAADRDSIGGIIECAATGMPAGVGSPMFDGVENRLAAAVFGIPAVKGVEFGAGFAAAAMRGSQHNDAYIPAGGGIATATNNHGGALGGITTGMPIVLRAAFKPTPSIARQQQTIRYSDGQQTPLCIAGRHDPCIVLRAAPCVEAVVAMVLLDMLLDARG
nr:chorismate synthase [bacterium]